MRHSLQVGFSFGLTSGVITTLGLIAGLATGTQSRLAVIGGVATIAVADALSDALGIHIAEESENIHTPVQIWVATLSTALSKALTAATFLLPLLLLPLDTAVWVSFVWGMLLIAVMSYGLARMQGLKPLHVIVEHVLVAAFVIAVAHGVGTLVAKYVHA